MDLHYWAIFFLTVLGVSLIPGPSTFIAFAHGASYGWYRSLHTAFGNSMASLLQATAASAGLGMIMSNSESLFQLVKYAGAAYLVYVGVQMWRSAALRVSIEPNTIGQGGQPKKLFVGGFTVALSNPKAIAFFTALFPQFLSVDGNGWVQLSVMVLLVAVGAFFVALFYGCIGSWVRGLELSQSFMTRIYKSTGGLFVASGVALAVARS